MPRVYGLPGSGLGEIIVLGEFLGDASEYELVEMSSS